MNNYPVVTSVPLCCPEALCFELNIIPGSEASHKGGYIPDRPKMPNQHQITLPGTGDPKTNKLQPLTVCATGEGADLGSLWLGSQEREEQQPPP